MNAGCTVTRAGFELRSACSSCDGHPACGHLMLSRRQPLYLEGDPARHVFAVVAGYVRETRTTADGRIQGVRLVTPGGVAGYEALRSPLYRTSADALTRARVCRVPRSEVELQLRTHGDQAVAMIGALVDELSFVRDSVLWIGALTAEERILALLARLAGPDREARFRLPITRLEMAELLGLSHSTVSRTLHRLAKAGALTLEGRMVRLAA
ncbi:MAG: Crp/Fnr family transcriptional regulator [Deltaproteobacteria bacterium]|nr:Crp/Fnr family transcriptional regulator [Deltaproteobacteria bacterium]